MSSGVDSSVAAALLIRSEHPRENLQPFYMANWSPSASPPSVVPPQPPHNKPQAKDSAAETQYLRDQDPGKCTEREFNDVKVICRALGLKEPLHLSFEKEYWNEVFTPMIEMFQRGQTPNPDVECNRQIKFGTVVRRLENEFQKDQNSHKKLRKWWMATGKKFPISQFSFPPLPPIFKYSYSSGHYAHILYHIPTNNYHLLRSRDPNKDQTFYLSTIPLSTLPHLLFPLGSNGLAKPYVKAYARELSLPGWRPGEPERQESMGLCFVEPGGGKGKSGFRRWLREYLDPEPGDIIVGPSRTYKLNKLADQPDSAPEGIVIGEHQGLWHATIGEKSHFEFPQGDIRYAGKWYVSRKNREKNTLEVVRGLDNARLFGKGMVVEQWRWLGDDAEKIALGIGHHDDSIITTGTIWEDGLVAQFRHRQKPFRITRVEVLEAPNTPGSTENHLRRLRILFDIPGRSIAPGQSAALWFGERCLGGGVVEDIVELN